MRRRYVWRSRAAALRRLVRNFLRIDEDVEEAVDEFDRLRQRITVLEQNLGRPAWLSDGVSWWRLP